MERNEAIGRLRLLYFATNAENKAALECLIPELVASEDERIREQIEQAIIEHDWSVTYKVSKGDCLAYLEKLKERKPAEWSEKDEKILDSLIRLYSKEYSANAWPWANGAITYGDVVHFLKSLRPDSYKNCNSRWRPSEKQMCELNWASKLSPILESLYNDLKKLI